MMEDWIEHRRGMDDELLGWMQPVGDGFVVIDLLGRARTDVVDWLSAEDFLDELGIGYLADIYELRVKSGEWLRVRLVEVSIAGVRAKKDDFGDMTAEQVYFVLPLPVADRLRARE